MSLTRFATLLMGALFLDAPLAEPIPVSPSTATPKGANAKRLADPLPPGALFRCGTSLELQRGAAPSLVVLSADAKRLAVADSQAIRVEDPATAKELWRRNVSVVPMALAFAPDGSMLAASDYLGVHLLDARTGKPIRDLVEARARMSSLDFSADGRVLATGSEGFGFGNTVRVWDTRTGKRLCAFKVPHDRTAHVALSADGKTLACWGSSVQENPLDLAGSKVLLWDVANNRSLRRIWCAGQVDVLAFSADGKKLAVVPGGGFQRVPDLQLLDADTGKLIRNLECEGLRGRAVLRKLTFSPDGKLITGITYGHGSKIVFWEAATGKSSSGAAGLAHEAQGVVFASGRCYAFGSAGTEVHVWDARTGELIRPVSGHTGPVGSVAFLRDGTRIISEARGGEIRLWHGSDGHLVRGYFLDANGQGGGTTGFSISRISPGGKFILSWKSQASTAQLFDANAGRKLRQFPTCATPALARRNPAFSFSADEQALLIESPDPKQAAADLYEIDTGKLLRHFEDRGGLLVDVAVSPDHRFVALVVENGQQRMNGLLTCEVRVFDAKSGKAQCSLPVINPQSYTILPLAFAPDGDFVMVQSTEAPMWQLLICDVRSGKRLCALRSTFSIPQLPCISPDGRTVAGVTYDHKNRRSMVIEIWEVCSGSTRREFYPGRPGISSLAFSPDGRRLAAGCQDSTILVWDLAAKLGDRSQSLLREEKSTLWAELASTDAGRADRAMTKLYAAPRDAVELIRSNLKPVTSRTWTQQEIAELLSKLDSRSFRERTQASAELSGVGESAMPLLRKAVESTPSQEVRERLQQLLDAISRSGFVPEMMRPMRALEVLEHVDSSEARAVLKSYAAGSADAPLTKYARNSLERLARNFEQNDK